jgi:hypothetical protein
MKALISWSVKDATFPAGTVPGSFRVAITGLAPVDVAGGSVEFTLDVGDYVVDVSRLDEAGNVLGTASKAFRVDAPATVTISVPDVVDVVVS